MKFFNFKNKRSNSFQNSDLTAYSGLTYAIGDVHGRCDLLEKLLSSIAADVDELRTATPAELVVTIVFLGDYIDRGLHSKQVVDFLLSFSLLDVKLVFLRGNHEQTALKFLNDVSIGMSWSEHGAIETLASYGVNIPKQRNNMVEWESTQKAFIKALPETHWSFFKSLKSYWIDEPFMFVHAGIDPNKPFDEQTDDEFLWVRDEFIQSHKRLPYVIVHGHTPELKPVWDGRRIGVDTGAYMTGKLSAVRIFNGDVLFLST